MGCEIRTLFLFSSLYSIRRNSNLAPGCHLLVTLKFPIAATSPQRFTPQNRIRRLLRTDYGSAQVEAFVTPEFG
jgi:hypothetical protein